MAPLPDFAPPMKTFFGVLTVAACAVSCSTTSRPREAQAANVPTTNRMDYNAQYQLGPDSQVQDVPHGEVIKMPAFTNSAIYPGTERDWWIYVPKQYDASKPACLMVFQDGGGYSRTNGEYRVPIVFDNLIAKNEMPVTIGIFIN